MALVALGCAAHDTSVGAVLGDGTCSNPAPGWVVGSRHSAADRALHIAPGCDGSVTVAGEFWGHAEFGDGTPSLDAAGSADLFLARYDRTGAPAWAARLGSTTALPRAGGVVQASDSSVLVAGSFTGSLDLVASRGSVSRTLVATGTQDAFVARYSAGGDVEDASAAGAAGAHVSAAAIAAAPDGSFWVAGQYDTRVAFDAATALSGAGKNDVFVARYADVGSVAWARRVGGTGDDAVTAIAPRADGSVFVGGSFDAVTTLGAGEPGETRLTSDGIDGFVALLAPGGDLVWAEAVGGPSTQRVAAVAALDDGGVLVAGTTSGTASIGAPGQGGVIAPIGMRDLFVARLGADGSVIRVLRAGSAQSDDFTGFSALADGSYVMTGSGVATMHFDEADRAGAELPAGAFIAFFDAAGHVVSVRRSHTGGETSALVATPAGALGAGFFVGAVQLFPLRDAPVTLQGAGLFLASYAP